MQTLTEFRSIIAKNIRSTIARMKKDGVTGASLDCLRQNTPTTGLQYNCPPSAYVTHFAEVAETIPSLNRFILND